MMQLTTRFIIFLMGVLFYLGLFAQQESTKENKTRPEKLIVLSPEEEAGAEAIYNNHCVACHQSGLAGAPVFRKQADWQSRLEKKTLEDLTNSAIKGINAMPAKGTCYECQEDDIKKAIQYMLPRHD